MSEMALKLIADNKKTRATFLDLGNCWLFKLPQELGELIWLEELSLSKEWSEFDGKVWKIRKTTNIGYDNELSSLYAKSSMAPNSSPLNQLKNLKKYG